MTTVPAFDLRRSVVRVTVESGTVYEPKIMPGDVVAMERRYGVKATDMEAGAALEWVLFMTWLGCARRGYQGDFEAFLNDVTDLDIQPGTAATGNPS